MEADKKYKPVLLCAGKLALAADLALKSNTKNLSERMEALEIALAEYNNEIMKLT